MNRYQWASSGHELLLFPTVKNNFSPSFRPNSERFSLYFRSEKSLDELVMNSLLFALHFCAKAKFFDSHLVASLKTLRDITNLLTLYLSQHIFLVRLFARAWRPRGTSPFCLRARAHRSIDCVHMHRDRLQTLHSFLSISLVRFARFPLAPSLFSVIAFSPSHIETCPSHRVYLIFLVRVCIDEQDDRSYDRFFFGLAFHQSKDENKI